MKEKSLSGSVALSPKSSPWPREGTYPVALVAVKPGTDEDHQEKCLSQLYDHMPEGMTPLATLKSPHQRRQLGVYWLSCPLPPRAPLDAQLVLLTNNPDVSPGQGLESWGAESLWPMPSNLYGLPELCSHGNCKGPGLPSGAGALTVFQHLYCGRTQGFIFSGHT